MHLCCSVDIAFFRSCVYSLMLSIAFWPPYGNYYEPCDDKLIKLVPRAATNGNFPPDFVLSHSGYSESVTVKKLHYFSLTVVFMNSSLNPLIYCWKMRHIRHAVINILRNVFQHRSRASHETLAMAGHTLP